MESDTEGRSKRIPTRKDDDKELRKNRSSASIIKKKNDNKDVRKTTRFEIDEPRKNPRSKFGRRSESDSKENSIEETKLTKAVRRNSDDSREDRNKKLIKPKKGTALRVETDESDYEARKRLAKDGSSRFADRSKKLDTSQKSDRSGSESERKYR